MNPSLQFNSRLIVGLVMILVAVLLLFLGNDDSTTAGAVVFGVLGLSSIALSRRK